MKKLHLFICLSAFIQLVAESTGQVSSSELKEQVKKLVNDELKDHSAALFPKGFIFVQFPKQKPPTELWRSLRWTDVTNSYAGHFFRAYGGGSASFGSIQKENAPRLSKVTSRSEKSSTKKEVKITPGATSEKLWTGNNPANVKDIVTTSFTMTDGEVRPKNYAIKIWKRS